MTSNRLKELKATTSSAGSRLVLRLPVGTQVVIRSSEPAGDGRLISAGSVGVVVNITERGNHTVRFAGGAIAELPRSVLAIRKHVQRSDAGLALPNWSEEALEQFVIYRCVIGSQAYGLATADSDVDRRGIFLPPADLVWSLAGVPDAWERQETQECYWELKKYLILALKANPNVLECLYSPLIEVQTDLAEELIANRQSFLSKMMYQTFNGYVLSQFKKLEADLRVHGNIKWKHAMHLVRLLTAGIGALRDGELTVDAGPLRERLLAIRNGAIPWDEVDAWRIQLHREFELVYASSRLPDQPDFRFANDFLIRARRTTL